MKNMEIKEIKEFLSDKGIDKHTRIDRGNGGQYLYNLLYEFHCKVRSETKEKIINHLKYLNLGE